MALTRWIVTQFALSALWTPQVPAQSAKDLLPLSFNPLPLGSIKANGWLLAELQSEAAGLAGHEFEFYSYVKESPWVGGTAEYSPLNEAFPYWFNGLVPLAYSLDDARLKDQVHQAAQIILDRQQDDGWIGPEPVNSRTFWGRYPVFLGLMNLVDADSTWERPVLDTWGKFNKLMHEMLQNDYDGLKKTPQSTISEENFGWGRVRHPDMLIALMWLLEKHPMGQEKEIIDNMNFINNGSLDWSSWYTEGTYPKEPLDESIGAGSPEFPFTHGVNVGQGFKAAAVARRLTHNENLIDDSMRSVNWTFTYHGAASGAIIADERLQGLSPWSGSVIPAPSALGVGYYADRAELTTFNAMPAQITPDWWGHQYVEQANQPFAKELARTPFWNVGPRGTVFGLEPNYPCCTANHPQGLPKYLMAVYATTADNSGLVAAQLSPAKVKTTLSSGTVEVDCQTNYPFGSTLTYAIKSEGAFDFFVRIPAWHTAASSIRINNAQPSPVSPAATSQLHKLTLPAGQSTVTLTLTSAITTSPRANDTIAVHHGALLYALEVAHSNASTAPITYSNSGPVPNPPAESRDWSYTNQSAWNYAIDPSTLTLIWDAEDGAPLAHPIFAPRAPPMHIEARGCLIDWPLYLESMPGSPPTGEARRCIAEVETVRLVPFGSAKTYMSELPTIRL